MTVSFSKLNVGLPKVPKTSLCKVTAPAETLVFSGSEKVSDKTPENMSAENETSDGAIVS